MVVESAIDSSDSPNYVYYTPSNRNKNMGTKSEDEYDFRNESGQQFLVRFPSPGDSRFYSPRFISPRLSKSAPGRNRHMIRYRINRSLNFEVGHSNNGSCALPKLKDRSPNENLHLSRSAKILKALNIDYSPKTSAAKKVIRTLNRHSTPHIRKRGDFNQENTSLTSIDHDRGITRSLNFENCEDSPSTSTHDTSIESMDENQNQTPSQKNKKIKKSHSYISLISSGSGSLSDFNLLSPARSDLRYELREKIDDIVHNGITPRMKFSRGRKDSLETGGLVVSTPRNLYNDYSDEDERPETPENAIRLIPESMSAIKKSHRKERISGRIAQRAQLHPRPVKMTDGDEGERPATPPSMDCLPANQSIRSIKKSHKKDKSKKKPSGYRSEDELSDTGSLFDYSVDENGEKKVSSKHCIESEPSITCVNSERTDVDEITESPSRNDDKNSSGVITPENRIDVLRRTAITDSIKKSHKKLKDSHKKVLRSRVIGQHIDAIESCEASQETENICDESGEGNRANTPDEKNSSRLLLAQFASVKKSHKKDKHRKTGFSRQYTVMNYEDESPATKTEACDTSSSMKINIPHIEVVKDTDSKHYLGASFTSANSSGSDYQSLGTSPLDRNDTKLSALISSPNKRNNSLMAEPLAATPSSKGQTMENITTEEEFKIFTPIKKRKALVKKGPQKLLNAPSTSTPEKPLSGRCDTPKLGHRILTPAKTPVNIQNENVRPEAVDETDDDNGRSTPENQGRMERISALSSIKKSHKKDKWAKSKRVNVRQARNVFESPGQDTSAFKPSADSRDSSFNSAESHSHSQPSTSYSEEGIIPFDSPMKTPPNGLRAKMYLKLVHATSIKRSHRKMRKLNQRRMHTSNPELSHHYKELEESAAEQNTTRGSDDSYHFRPLEHSNNQDEEVRCPRASESQSFRENCSHEGSIFGSDDEMNTPYET